MVSTVCNSFCSFIKHFSVVKFLCINLRLITANFYNVQKFRKVAVDSSVLAVK